MMMMIPPKPSHPQTSSHSRLSSQTCPHGHFLKNVKPSLDCVAFTSTPQQQSHTMLPSTAVTIS